MSPHAKKLKKLKPRRRVTIFVGIFKGGPGKSMIALHVMWAALARGWKVLFVDSDRQGDSFARLGGNDEERKAFMFSPGCVACFSPDAVNLTDEILEPIDLVIVDTPPAHSLPTGTPKADLVLIPVDGLDAARQVRNTVADIPEGVEGWIMMNKVGLAGKRHARVLNQIEAQLPRGVAVSRTRIPIGGEIARTDWSRRPAWEDPYRGKAAHALRTCCDEVLDWVVENIH